MDLFGSIIVFCNDILWSYVLIIMLISVGVYFSFRTKFVQVRFIGEMFRLLGEGVGTKTGKNKVSSFQAFCISTASRVGVGNIAGIAIAIVTGGSGAIFWMWIIAILGSATGFIESTLAQIYKIQDADGGYRGGPAYYIKYALGKPRVAAFFAILISITFGLIFNSVQANTITIAMQSAFGFERMTTGIVIAILTTMIIFGGVKRIATVSEWLVPIMAGVYILVAIYITIINISLLPSVFKSIVSNAFSADAALGGGIGAALMTGIKRGLFSNEAGMGSVPNAAAAAEASHPVKQGLIQALGVFVDTLMVCTSSAFIVLLTTDYAETKLTGIELVQAALTMHLGASAPALLAIFVLMFAFSSIIGNYYYGESNIGFLHSSKTWLTIFRIAVIGMVLFGSVAKISIVWDMADLFMAFMAITNLIAILCLAKYAIIALNDYAEQKRKGIKEPTFDPSILPSKKGSEVWQKIK
ncbi:MAG: alsT 1 [Firmicutes bacterium]|nr:alsT 1 [Bacillota bacterium]